MTRFDEARFFLGVAVAYLLPLFLCMLLIAFLEGSVREFVIVAVPSFSALLVVAFVIGLIKFQDDK
jgi:hypothetical protein